MAGAEVLAAVERIAAVHTAAAELVPVVDVTEDK